MPDTFFLIPPLIIKPTISTWINVILTSFLVFAAAAWLCLPRAKTYHWGHVRWLNPSAYHSRMTAWRWGTFQPPHWKPPQIRWWRPQRFAHTDPEYSVQEDQWNANSPLEERAILLPKTNSEPFCEHIFTKDIPMGRPFLNKRSEGWSFEVPISVSVMDDVCV